MTSPLAEPRGSTPGLLWRDVLHALRGGRRDYTQEPLSRAILLLSIPMVLELLMESLFAVVDIFWVSRLGSDAVAIIGLTESVMTLIYAAAIGLSIAASATIARRLGENATERAAQAVAHSLILGLGISAALSLTFGYVAADILQLLGASADAIALGADFARIMFYGNATVVALFLINAIFRGAGDAVLAMRTLCLANIVNMVLCPAFIFGWGPFPELGLTGAAVATNLARGVGVLYQLWQLTGQHSRIRIRLCHFRPAPVALWRLLVVSTNGIAQLLIGTTSWIGLFKILAAFGSGAVAGYTIAARVTAFALLPALGVASAAATLVGQNLGASQPQRADDVVRIAIRVNMPLFTIIGVAVAVFSSQIARVFTTDPQVHLYASLALWIVSITFPLYTLAVCLSAAFNGAGDTWTPTRTSFFCLWLGQVPLAWLLATVFQMGPLGVFIAAPASLSVLAVWNYLLFRQGTWKLKRL